MAAGVPKIVVNGSINRIGSMAIQYAAANDIRCVAFTLN